MINLTFRDFTCMNDILESEMSKCKAYTAFCTSKDPVTKEDLDKL